MRVQQFVLKQVYVGLKLGVYMPLSRELSWLACQVRKSSCQKRPAPLIQHRTTLRILIKHFTQTRLDPCTPQRTPKAPLNPR